VMGSNWWGFRMTIPSSYPYYGDSTYQADFAPGQYCVSITSSGTPLYSNLCVGYGTASSMAPVGKAFFDTFGILSVLLWVGLLMVIFALVFLILGIFWPKIGLGAVVFGIVGSVLVLVAPIYLFAGLPGAWNSANSSGGSTSGNISGFFGSTSIDYSGQTVQMSYGGGVGWFLAFIAFALFLAAWILTIAMIRRIAPLGNVRLRPVQYYPLLYPPYQQPQMGYPVQQYPVSPYPYWPMMPIAPPLQPVIPPQTGAPQPQANVTEPATVPASQPALSETRPSANCPSCGSSVSAGHVFCGVCGTKVG